MHKRFLFITVLIIILLEVKAQSYQPLVIEGAHWQMYDGGCYFGCDGTVSYPYWNATYWFKLQGDTTISGTLYKKLFESSYSTTQYSFYQTAYSGSPWTLTALLREDTTQKKVYFIGTIGGCLPQALTDTLLYDFSKNAGDSLKQNFIDFNNGPCDTAYCLIDSINLSGFSVFPRRTSYIHSSSISGNADYRLYESIGPSYGLFGGPGPSFEGSYSSGLTGYCVGTDSVCWGGYIPTSINDVDAEHTVNIYPNPTTGRVQINAETKIQQIEIQTINGEKIFSTTPNTANYRADLTDLPKGFYFCIVHFTQGFVVRKIVID